MKVFVREYFDTLPDDCDSSRNQGVKNGIVLAYQELIANGLQDNTFEDQVCTEINYDYEEDATLNVRNGDIVFIDSSISPGTALFKLNADSVTEETVKDIVIRMHDLEPVPGQPGIYQDGDGKLLDSNKTSKGGICPSWLPVFLKKTMCSQYECPEGIPSVLCNNDEKFLKWIFLLLFLLFGWQVYKRVQ